MLFYSVHPLFYIFGFAITNMMLTMFISIVSFLLWSYGINNSVIYWLSQQVNALINNVCDQFLESNYSWRKLLGPMFYFIAINNILGCLLLLPIYAVPMFAIGLAVIVVVVAVSVGLYTKKHHMLLDLTPSHIPVFMKPLFFILELINITIKPLTLVIRILLNIAIGHFVLHVLQSVAVLFKGLSLAFLPVLVMVNIIEICTGVLQAYLYITFAALFIGALTNKHGH